MKELNDVQEALATPFEGSDVKWKPQVTTKGRNKEPIMRGNQQVAGCTAHIDARSVMNRLDEVVGVGGWSDTYKVLDGKHVECTLTVLGVSKSDVGETNEGGFADPIKSAYSDALKRAAVKFGIGRHLYDMEMEWLPFDGYKILEQPTTTQPAKQRHTQKQKPRQTPPPPPEPGTWEHVEEGGALPMNGRVADLRAFLEGQGAKTKLGLVADKAAQTGLYNHASHALNAIKSWPDMPDGIKVTSAKSVTTKTALAIFDWLIERKSDEEE